MPTTDQVRAQQLADGSADYDAMYGDRVPVERPAKLSAKSSAARIAAGVCEDEQAAATERDWLLTDLQAKRRKRKAERARTGGLSSAEILAARHLGAG